MSPRQRDCKRNVHDALVGGSTRTEIVLPMSWEGGTIHWRDVDEQTSVPSRSGELWSGRSTCEFMGTSSTHSTMSVGLVETFFPRPLTTAAPHATMFPGTAARLVPTTTGYITRTLTNLAGATSVSASTRSFLIDCNGVAQWNSALKVVGKL